MSESEYRELLIGCGRSRQKRVAVPGSAGPAKWRDLTTLDINPYVGADLQCDLNGSTPWVVFPARDRLIQGLSDSHAGIQTRSTDYEQIGHRLLTDYWDEIHAYEVLEHLGQLGDAHSFLAHFSELWRLLKPNGYLCATVPSRYSPWLWGDPSHRRAIVPESLVFLDQEQYALQCDGPEPTPMSDFP